MNDQQQRSSTTSTTNTAPNERRESTDDSAPTEVTQLHASTREDPEEVRTEEENDNIKNRIINTNNDMRKKMKKGLTTKGCGKEHGDSLFSWTGYANARTNFLLQRGKNDRKHGIEKERQRQEEDIVFCPQPCEDVEQNQSEVGQADVADDVEGQREDGELSGSPLEEESPTRLSSLVRPGAYRLRQGVVPERVPSIGNVVTEEELSVMPESSRQQLQPHLSTNTREDQTSNVIMPEAKVVVEPDLVEAMPVRRKRQVFILLAIVLIAAIVSAVVASIVVSRVNSSTSPTNDPPTTVPTTSTEPPTTLVQSGNTTVEAFRASLSNETNVAIDIRSTAQYKAFQWLTKADKQHFSQLHRMTQRFALATLFYAMNGDQWIGWLNETLHECLWDGCECTEDKMVNSLQITGIGRTLPPEISLLSASLESLALDGTDSLEVFNANQLPGTIPPQIFTLTNLKMLYLVATTLTGRIPSEFGTLTKLRELAIFQNQLSQSIPVSLVHLTNLVYLNLQGNLLTGSIPSEINRLTNLQELYLGENKLNGTIPAFLSDLTDMQLLYLVSNKLTGSIPSELGNLVYLQELYLRGNELTGSIPSELGNLTNLQDLSLWGNWLTGKIPSELGNLTKLQDLELWKNKLTGSIPTELGNLTNLDTLDLEENLLMGRMPSELGHLTNLQTLYLGQNSLTGSIPTELGRLSLLNELYLHNNTLNQTIPIEVAGLTKLVKLHLYENNLTGTIPSELGELSNLSELFVDGNQLSGTMPPVICYFIEENALNVATDCNLVNCSCGCSCVVG